MCIDLFLFPGIAGVTGATVGLGLSHEATHGSRKSKNLSHDVIDSDMPCFQGMWLIFPCTCGQGDMGKWATLDGTLGPDYLVIA